MIWVGHLASLGEVRCTGERAQMHVSQGRAPLLGSQGHLWTPQNFNHWSWVPSSSDDKATLPLSLGILPLGILSLGIPCSFSQSFSDNSAAFNPPSSSIQPLPSLPCSWLEGIFLGSLSALCKQPAAPLLLPLRALSAVSRWHWGRGAGWRNVAGETQVEGGLDPTFWVVSVLSWLCSWPFFAGVLVLVILGRARDASSFLPKITLLDSKYIFFKFYWNIVDLQCAI